MNYQYTKSMPQFIEVQQITCGGTEKVLIRTSAIVTVEPDGQDCMITFDHDSMDVAESYSDIIKRIGGKE
jgi:hypothetical protein